MVLPMGLTSYTWTVSLMSLYKTMVSRMFSACLSWPTCIPADFLSVTSALTSPTLTLSSL